MKPSLNSCLLVAAMLGLVFGLASCSNPLHNENDWAMRKGASPAHVPMEVSKKVYR